MNFNSKTTHESASCPGVRFTIRNLNEIQRTERDLSLLDARARLSELYARFEKLPNPDLRILTIKGKAIDEKREETEAEKVEIAAIEDAPAVSSQRIARARINAEISLVVDGELKPAYIRAGLISIEGFEVDEAAQTKAEAVIENAPDDLLNEVYAACFLASGLGADREKNSQSPGTPQAAESGQTNSTIATDAESSDT